LLMSLYRSGPLRQRLCKGYAVVSPQGAVHAAAATAAVLAAPPRLPNVPTGGAIQLRGNGNAPTVLWIDSGRVWLHNSAARAAVTAAIADATAAVAADLHRRGALLVPSGRDNPEGPSEFCADLHSVEAAGAVERELVCNLLREHSPSIIAFTGRPLYGARGSARGGSARLSSATDQVGTRYIASFSPQHLDRVRASLRREERLARLEAMDVNPFGDVHAGADGDGDVTVRLIDAQISVASAMTHALLLQALAMQARDLERSGRRIGNMKQALLERNRSRAVAHGLAAEFDVETRPARTGGDQRRPVRSTVTADQAVRRLLHSLLPYFRQLDATNAELESAFIGLELSKDTGDSVYIRNEADLMCRWSEGRVLDATVMAEGVRSPAWLRTDHVGGANRERTAGTAAAAGVWLAEQLAPTAGKPSARADRPASGRRPNAGRPNRFAFTEEQLFEVLRAPGVAESAIAAALRAYGRHPADLRLVKALGRLDRDEAKTLRRSLRPPFARRIRCDAPLTAWDGGAGADAVRSAAEHGVVLMQWDCPVEDRQRVRESLASAGRPPRGTQCIILTDTAYRDRTTDVQRATIEVLLVADAPEAENA